MISSDHAVVFNLRPYNELTDVICCCRLPGLRKTLCGRGGTRVRRYRGGLIWRVWGLGAFCGAIEDEAGGARLPRLGLHRSGLVPRRGAPLRIPAFGDFLCAELCDAPYQLYGNRLRKRQADGAFVDLVYGELGFEGRKDTLGNGIERVVLFPTAK